MQGYGPDINFQKLDDARCKEIQDGFKSKGNRGTLPPARDCNMKVTPYAASVLDSYRRTVDFYEWDDIGGGKKLTGRTLRRFKGDSFSVPAPSFLGGDFIGPVESTPVLMNRLEKSQVEHRRRVVGRLVADSRKEKQKNPTLTEEEEKTEARKHGRLIPCCQYCGKLGHAAATCKKRKRERPEEILPLPTPFNPGAEEKIQELRKGKHKLNRKERQEFKEHKKQKREEAKTKKKNKLDFARKLKEQK